LNRQLDLLEAPSNLGLRPPSPGVEPGTRRAPLALRAAGLNDLLKPSRIVRIEAPAYEADELRVVNIRNLTPIAHYARSLAAEISKSVRSGSFPLVIGGDCSILLGAALALKRLGTYGLLFIDGHTDFFLPEQSATGGAAGMDLALATGWGPPALTNMDTLAPYFDIRNVLLLGNRDLEPRCSASIPTAAESGADYWDLARLRRAGTVSAASVRLHALAARVPFWVHLDVDALDDRIMPAVDSRQADGLSWAEIAGIVHAAFETGRAVGMEITIFDPDLDADGAIASTLARHIATWFRA